MQKSKNTTIIFIVILIIFFYINQTFLSSLGNIYTFIINPLSFIGIVVILKFMIPPLYNTNKYKKEIIQYVLITMLLYAVIYLLSGLFTGYGRNPYVSDIKGIITNLFCNATIFCAVEYIRYKLIHNVYKNDEKIIFVLLVVAFSIWDFKFFNIITEQLSVYTIFKQTFYAAIPIITKNVLFTYISLKSDYVPSIVYELLYHIILWISPILPKSPWVLEAMINIIFPLILLMYIRYYIYKKDRFHFNKIQIESNNPFGLIVFSILFVMLIWFTLGILPIKPVGILTASMYPEIKVGDAVIIEKCDANDIALQDVIEYEMEGYTVIHRVLNKYTKDGEIFFTTKGDNNEDADPMPVSEEQLVGKAIFKIPYIAMPSVWLHSINVEKNIEVETGK